VDLESVADELYGLPLREFVSTRTARAKQARADGDRDLATAIAGLTKPTRVAWLVNQLVRQRPEEIEPLLSLGAGLREATATLSGDDLRRLSRQQHQLVQAMVTQARAIASAAGEQVSSDTADGVEETLRAGLADDALAAELSTGRLTERLQFAGFGGAAGGRAPVAAPLPTRRGPAAKADAEAAAAERRERLEQAERAAEQARTDVSDAQAAREAAQTSDDAAAAEVSRVSERLTALREELEQATVGHREAEHDARQAHTVLEQADRSVRAALRRLDAAETERQKLAAEKF
jgi:hypothetical protein